MYVAISKVDVDVSLQTPWGDGLDVSSLPPLTRMMPRLEDAHVELWANSRVAAQGETSISIGNNDLHRCAHARRAAGLCLRACILCVQLWLAAGPGSGLLGVTKD